MTRGRKSERQFRALFGGRRPIELARNPFMAARRKAGRRFGLKRGALGVRACQALNVMGRRIWYRKPRLFGGFQWRGARATVAKSAEWSRLKAAGDWLGMGVPF